VRVDNERYPRQVGEIVRDDPDAPLGQKTPAERRIVVSDREKKAERIFLDVVFLGVATAAVLVFGGTMLVLAWLLVALLGGT
jgi:hypothetical protein